MLPPHAPTPPSQTSTIAAGLWQQMERKIYFDMLTVGREVPPLLPPATYSHHFIAFRGQRIRSSNQPNKFQMVFTEPNDSIAGLISHTIYGVF